MSLLIVTTFLAIHKQQSIIPLVTCEMHLDEPIIGLFTQTQKPRSGSIEITLDVCSPDCGYTPYPKLGYSRKYMHTPYRGS